MKDIHQTKQIPKASEFIADFSEIVAKRLDIVSVVLVARESGREQHRKGNLKDQIVSLERELTKLGARVLRCFSYVASGWDTDRAQLEAAAVFANKYGAILVAESSDRYGQSSTRRRPRAQQALIAPKKKNSF